MFYLLFKKSVVGDFFTNLLEIFVEFQNTFGAAAVEPVADKRQEQLNTIRIGGVGDLFAMEFYLMNS